MQEDYDRTLEGKESAGREGERPSPPKNVLIGLLLALLASFPLWPSWLRHLGLVPEAVGKATCSVPEAVEVVDTANNKTYVMPSEFKVSTVPDELDVKSPPGTSGGGYCITVAEKTFTGNVLPGKSDRYVVLRTKTGDIDFVKLNQSHPALGGQ